MARLASFYESRPEPGSILALLEANGSGARHLANTAIRLAQQESLDGNDPEYGADVEPLPLIDYHLLSTLLNYCRPTLTSRDLKRFDYLADARGLYYKAHNDFEYFYRGLQDVYASGIILDMEKQKLELSGALNARELEWNQAARIENLEEKKKVLENLEARRKKRDKCTAWFSNMKVEFLNSEMPRLVYVGKHFFHKSHLPDNPTSYPSSTTDSGGQTSSRPATQPLGRSPYLSPYNEHTHIRESIVKTVNAGDTDEWMAMDVDPDL